MAPLVSDLCKNDLLLLAIDADETASLQVIRDALTGERRRQDLYYYSGN